MRNTTLKNHIELPDYDGFNCSITGEHTHYIFWHNDVDVEDECPHCQAFLPSHHLALINMGREQEQNRNARELNSAQNVIVR